MCEHTAGALRRAVSWDGYQADCMLCGMLGHVPGHVVSQYGLEKARGGIVWDSELRPWPASVESMVLDVSVKSQNKMSEAAGETSELTACDLAGHKAGSLRKAETRDGYDADCMRCGAIGHVSSFVAATQGVAAARAQVEWQQAYNSRIAHNWMPSTPPAPVASVEALTAALFRVLNEEEICRRAELSRVDLFNGYKADKFEATARKMRSLRLDLEAQARNMAGKVFDYLQRGAK